MLILRVFSFVRFEDTHSKISRGLIFHTTVPYYDLIAGSYVAIHFIMLLILLLRVELNYKKICG
jgi:hypothetical protein